MWLSLVPTAYCCFSASSHNLISHDIFILTSPDLPRYHQLFITSEHWTDRVCITSMCIRRSCLSSFRVLKAGSSAPFYELFINFLSTFRPFFPQNQMPRTQWFFLLVLFSSLLPLCNTVNSVREGNHGIVLFKRLRFTLLLLWLSSSSLITGGVSFAVCFRVSFPNN